MKLHAISVRVISIGMVLAGLVLAGANAQARDGDDLRNGAWGARVSDRGQDADRGQDGDDHDGRGAQEVRHGHNNDNHNFRGSDRDDDDDHWSGDRGGRDRHEWREHRDHDRWHNDWNRGRGDWHYDRHGRRFFDPPGFYLGLATGALFFDGYDNRRNRDDDYGNNNCRDVYVTRYDRYGRAYSVRTTQCWDLGTQRWCPTREW